MHQRTFRTFVVLFAMTAAAACSGKAAQAPDREAPDPCRFKSGLISADTIFAAGGEGREQQKGAAGSDARKIVPDGHARSRTQSEAPQTTTRSRPSRAPRAACSPTSPLRAVMRRK